MADTHDLAELGAQYREAKDSIATHRAAQADAEIAYRRLAVRLGSDHADVAAAHAAMTKAAADVDWCRAVTVAAGEQFKGVPFDYVPREASRAAEIRRQALRTLDALGEDA